MFWERQGDNFSCKRAGCGILGLIWEMMGSPLERRWVVSDWHPVMLGEGSTFCCLKWTAVNSSVSHLRVGLRLGSTAWNRGDYRAAGVRGEFLAGSSMKLPCTTCCLSCMDPLGEGSRSAEGSMSLPSPVVHSLCLGTVCSASPFT